MNAATDYRYESTALLHTSPEKHRVTYGTDGKTHANGPRQRSSHRWNIMMAMGVAFLICVMSVFVRAAISILQNRRLNRTIDDCASFDETGRSVIVPVYQSMMQNIHRLFPNTTTISNMVQPSEVEELRKTILRTRDLIDIFSPIFPNRSNVSSSSPTTLWKHPHHTKDSSVNSMHSEPYVVEVDLWSILRAHLDAGYTIIGQYQDLDHSHINYTMHLNHRLRGEVLQWKHQFIQNATSTILITDEKTSLSGTPNVNDSFLQFLQTHHADHHRRRIPGNPHHKESRLFWRNVEPLPHLDDCACSSLQRLIQKQQHMTRQYYNRALSHESVLDEAAHTDVHNLRKILRCWIDEYNLLASFCDGSPERSAIFPENRTYFDAFNKARQLLGILNDDWNAYTYYATRSVHTLTTPNGNSTHEVTMEHWRLKVDTDWRTFYKWTVAVNFSAMIDAMVQE